MEISKENKRSGRNLNELNECSWAGGSGKQEKQWFLLSSLLFCEPLVPVEENTDRKRKKRRKKGRKKYKFNSIKNTIQGK